MYFYLIVKMLNTVVYNNKISPTSLYHHNVYIVITALRSRASGNANNSQ